MKPRDSLDVLAAFEDEAVRKRETELAQEALPPPSKNVWGVLTASFRVPPTFVMRWNALTIARRRRVRRLLVVLALTAVAGLGYVVSTLPIVRARTASAWQRLQTVSRPYVAQVRGFFTPSAAAPEGDRVPAASHGALADSDAPATAERRKQRRKAHRPTKRRAKSPAQSPGRRGRSAAGQALTRDAIVAAVREQMSSLLPCIKRARAAGELVPGRHTFVFDWVIEPSGAVSRPKLTGPSRVLGSSLPACFAARMGGWRFPRSAHPTPVNRFPLPVTVP